jgi:hypothetical protein
MRALRLRRRCKPDVARESASRSHPGCVPVRTRVRNHRRRPFDADRLPWPRVRTAGRHGPRPGSANCHGSPRRRSALGAQQSGTRLAGERGCHLGRGANGREAGRSPATNTGVLPVREGATLSGGRRMKSQAAAFLAALAMFTMAWLECGCGGCECVLYAATGTADLSLSKTVSNAVPSHRTFSDATGLRAVGTGPPPRRRP